MSDKNIFQRMSAITAEMQTVAKNLDVSTGKGKGYKAVSERDIIDAVKPLEAKHGVYSYPVMRETVDSQLLETENDYGKKTTFYTRIKTVYRFVNIDKPEEFIDIESFSVGLDTQDKGDGKAMTYGDKYALMKAYKISTGDDPDDPAVTPPAEYDYRKRPSTQIKQSATDEIVPTCAKCGTEIAENVHDYSVRYWGKPLCRDCQQTEPKNENRRSKA